jgi:drug/metabolite transporter (DMT)-like permease
MPELSALVLVVLCALAWSGLDLLRKLLAHRMGVMALVCLLTAGQLPLMLAWWHAGGGGGIAPGYWWPALSSLGLNIGANFAFVAALRLSPLSLTIPLLSLTPVFAALLAVPLLGEHPTVEQWGGIALVVGGALLLNMDFAHGIGPVAWWRGVRRERGSALMFVVALVWALTLPLDKLAIRHAPPALHAAVLCAGVMAAALAVLVVQRRLADLRTDGRTAGMLVAAAVVSGLGMAFQLLAMQAVWVGLLEATKRGVGSVMALVWGLTLFGERPARAQWLAIGAMAVGVVLLLWPA